MNPFYIFLLITWKESQGTNQTFNACLADLINIHQKFIVQAHQGASNLCRVYANH